MALKKCERCELEKLATQLERLGQLDLRALQRKESELPEHTCQGSIVGPAQAAQIAGVSRQTIYRWIETGRLRPIDTKGRPRFRREDVASALARPQK